MKVDKSSTLGSTYFLFPDGDYVKIQCYDWSEKLTKEKNWIDHLEKLGNEGLAGLDLIEKYGAETIALIKSLPENKK